MATFRCSLVAYAWNKSIADGHCIDLVAYFRHYTLPNILTNSAMRFLPLPLLWQLNTSFGQKVVLTFIFEIGSLQIVFGILHHSIADIVALGIFSASFRMAVLLQHDALTDRTCRYTNCF